VIYCGKGKIRIVLETLSLESLTFRKREKMKHYKKELLTLIILLILTNCSSMHPSKINSYDECAKAGFITQDSIPSTYCSSKKCFYDESQLIKMPPNVISVNECIEKGGKVWNTLGETSYNGELIATVKGLRCPCVCLIESHPKFNGEEL